MKTLREAMGQPSDLAKAIEGILVSGTPTTLRQAIINGIEHAIKANSLDAEAVIELHVMDWLKQKFTAAMVKNESAHGAWDRIRKST